MSIEKVLLGKLPLKSAEIVREQMIRAGFELQLLHNKQTCNSGCSTEVEVWCHPDDASDVRREIEQLWNQSIEGDEALTSMKDTVVDMDSKVTQCPACATSFAPTLGRCPECELEFGIPQSASSGSCSSGKCK